MLTSRGLPAGDSICVLEAEPGELDIKKANLLGPSINGMVSGGKYKDMLSWLYYIASSKYYSE